MNKKRDAHDYTGRHKKKKQKRQANDLTPFWIKNKLGIRMAISLAFTIKMRTPVDKRNGMENGVAYRLQLDCNSICIIL
jgi:hypothetical protein